MRVVTLTGLVMDFVMMRQIMLVVILTVVTVVEIISTLNIVLFVLVMNKIQMCTSFRFNLLCTYKQFIFEASLGKSSEFAVIFCLRQLSILYE